MRIGTLFNRFGSREGLIDAVIPDVAARRLQDLSTAVMTGRTPRERLEVFVRGMIDLQQDDPALNDAILRRYPDAAALLGVRDRSTALGQRLVREAHADGSLSLDSTEDDLFSLRWLAGTASREESALRAGCGSSAVDSNLRGPSEGAHRVISWRVRA